MRWVLVHRESDLGTAWREAFAGLTDVSVVGGDICEIACDAVVSPANSFGFMDGGLDLALSHRFGWNLQEEVQRRIAARPIRELLVGESLIVRTGDTRVPWLVVAPTMRVPMRLRQSVNAYLAMKAILSGVLHHAECPRIETVAIPGLGTGVGALPADVAAIQMRRAFGEVLLSEASQPEDFGEAQKRHRTMNPEINLWDR